MSTKALSLSETAIVLISRLRKWYPCGRNLEPHYLTKMINIGHQSDGFYVTELVYLLSNVSWWLPCQQSPQTHFNSIVTSVKQVNEKYADVCLLWKVGSSTLKNPLLLLSFFFLSCFHKALFYVSPFNAKVNMAEIWKVQFSRHHVQFFKKQNSATFILNFLSWPGDMTVNKGQIKP